jgi:hypothetical protein
VKTTPKVTNAATIDDSEADILLLFPVGIQCKFIYRRVIIRARRARLYGDLAASPAAKARVLKMSWCHAEVHAAARKKPAFFGP